MNGATILPVLLLVVVEIRCARELALILYQKMEANLVLVQHPNQGNATPNLVQVHVQYTVYIKIINLKGLKELLVITSTSTNSCDFKQ